MPPSISAIDAYNGSARSADDFSAESNFDADSGAAAPQIDGLETAHADSNLPKSPDTRTAGPQHPASPPKATSPHAAQDDAARCKEELDRWAQALAWCAAAGLINPSVVCYVPPHPAHDRTCANNDKVAPPRPTPPAPPPPPAPKGTKTTDDLYWPIVIPLPYGLGR
jgi:hypothetical protein